MRAHHAGGSWLSPLRRASLYLRDGHACVYCGSKSSLTIDHVVPGSNHRSTNLVTCCRRCNGSKADEQLEAWLARKGWLSKLPSILSQAASPVPVFEARRLAAAQKREAARRRLARKQAKRLRSRWG